MTVIRAHESAGEPQLRISHCYNAGDIPWVYPPLGIYLAPLLGGGQEWFRILPALFAAATLPAVWLLARGTSVFEREDQ